MRKSRTLSDYESLAEVALSDPPLSSLQRAGRPRSGAGTPAAPVDAGLEGPARGHASRIGELAERLQIQHHSAVELVNRLLPQRLRAAASWRRGPARGAACADPEGRKDPARVVAASSGELRMRGPALVAALKRAMQAGKGSAMGLRPQTRRPASRKKQKNVRTMSNQPQREFATRHNCGHRRAGRQTSALAEPAQFRMVLDVVSRGGNWSGRGPDRIRACTS